MFDFDICKMLLVAIVALVVVGPKELPQVLRLLGQAMKRLQGLQLSVRTAANQFIAEAGLDSIGKEFSTFERDVRANIALDPATAMRGTLPGLSRLNTIQVASTAEANRYSSPEMEAYLSPAPEVIHRAQIGETPSEHAA